MRQVMIIWYFGAALHDVSLKYCNTNSNIEHELDKIQIRFSNCTLKEFELGEALQYTALKLLSTV